MAAVLDAIPIMPKPARTHKLIDMLPEEYVGYSVRWIRGLIRAPKETR